MISSTLFSFVFALVAFLALAVPSSAQWRGAAWRGPRGGRGVAWRGPRGGRGVAWRRPSWGPRPRWGRGGSWNRGWNGGRGWRHLSEDVMEEDEPLDFDKAVPMEGLTDAEVMPTTPVVP